MTQKHTRAILVGLGTVNRGWLNLMQDKQRELHQRGIHFDIVGVADSSGVAVNDQGYSVQALLALKGSGQKVSSLTGYRPGVPAAQLLDHVEADVLIESSPANLIDGEPGLTIARAALHKGISVVFANKTPLVFAFDELQLLCERHKGRMAYSATVCGGLPVVNVLKRDLKLAQIKRIRGIFNATSNFVLRELERGGTLEEAIREAQRLGAAEADPTHDLHGHDTANKLYIIMKSCSDFRGSIADIRTTGIQRVTTEGLKAARSREHIIKLMAEAVQVDGGWNLSVAPAEIPRSSFLGSCEGWEMGFEIETDLYERICMKNYEADPMGTSAAVMRDCLELVQ